MFIAGSRRAMVVRSALMAPLCLIGTFLVGGLPGDLIFFGMPGHMQDKAKVALAVLPALVGVIAGGALWGKALAGSGPQLPIHVILPLLFTPAAVVVAATSAFALAIRLALGSSLAAGLTFLAVDLLLDAAGYRVGAPGAAERATMITVMLAGNVAASLVGGATVGMLLSAKQRP